MKKNIALAMYFGLLIAVEAHAILGFGDIVVDIGANLKLAEEALQMAAQNEKFNKMLDFMQRNSALINAGIRLGFTGHTQPYYVPQIGNVFGETSQWPIFLSGGLPSTVIMDAAMRQATYPASPSPLFRGMLGSPALIRLASTEIQDALVRNAFLTSSSTRAQQGLNNLAIQNLQSACLEGTGGDDFLENNAQQNCSTAAGILGAQQTQIGDGISAASLDLQAAHAMDERNDKMAQLNEVSQELTDDMGRSDYFFSSAAIQDSLLGTL